MIQIYVSDYPVSQLIKVRVESELERILKDIKWNNRQFITLQEGWSSFSPDYGESILITADDKAFVKRIMSEPPF